MPSIEIKTSRLAAEDSLLPDSFIKLPRGVAEECVRSDFLALERHMKHCSPQDRASFICGMLLENISHFLKTKIICSICIAVFAIAMFNNIL